MSYTLSIMVQLGSDNAGLTLSAQLLNLDGSAHGTPILTGFTEIQDGDYIFAADLPDDYQGAISFFNEADASYLTSMSINPAEYQNADIPSSLIAAQTTSILVKLSGSTVVVRNPVLAAGRIDLLRGDDYIAANARQLTFQPDDPDAWPILAVGDPLVFGVGNGKGLEFEGKGVIITADPDPLVGEIEIYGADTVNVAAGHYRFTLRTNGATTETLAEGVLNLHDAWGGY